MRIVKSRSGTSRYGAGVALLFASVITAASGAAQGSVDRSTPPTPGKAPTLRVPTWTKTTLSNGAELIVVEKHDLPLVAFNLDFIGGAATYEPADKRGVAAFAGQMLSEGTTTKSADQLSDAQQLLGTSINASVGSEGGSVRFTSLKDKFEPALTVLVDMLLNSTYPDSALERIRGRTLVTLTQQKDEPNAIAANVFAKLTYGDTHPFGRVVTEQSVSAITRDDVVAFAKAYYQPGRAVITVAGDIKAADAKAAVEKALAVWPKGGERPTFEYGPLPTPSPRTIYLVDKPRAPQSVFSFGTPGPSRDTPDFYALSVMNQLLGGMFQSRLNHDIREVRGYSYGVGSGFAFGHGPGAFNAGGGIVSAKSDSALVRFMYHFNGVRGDSAFTADEMQVGKESLIQSLPGRFATVNGTAAAISSIFTQYLPETYWTDYAAKINAVTGADLERVAKQHIDLEHMNLVIVGDRAAIESSLRKTGIAPIKVLDVEGRPVTR